MQNGMTRPRLSTTFVKTVQVFEPESAGGVCAKPQYYVWCAQALLTPVQISRAVRAELHSDSDGQRVRGDVFQPVQLHHLMESRDGHGGPNFVHIAMSAQTECRRKVHSSRAVVLNCTGSWLAASRNNSI